MNNWKLKYKKVGHFITTTNWIDEATAQSWFSQLEADASCTWCELLCNDGECDCIMKEFYR